MLRSALTLCLIALLNAHPIIDLARAEIEPIPSAQSLDCFDTSEHHPSEGHSTPQDDHCCVFCKRAPVALPTLSHTALPGIVTFIVVEERFPLKLASIGPPDIQTRPQQSRAPPQLA